MHNDLLAILSASSAQMALATTFTLAPDVLDQEILPAFGSDRPEQCLVLVDPWGFGEALGPGTPTRLECSGHVLRVACQGRVFHPKIWLLLSEPGVTLVAGSGNLDSGGYGGNDECFDHVFFESRESRGMRRAHADSNPPGGGVVRGLSRFLSGLRAMLQEHGRASGRDQDPDVAVLDQMRTRLDSLAPSPTGGTEWEGIGFVSSFDGPLHEVLGSRVPPGGTLYVAAPMFGGSFDGVALLRQSLQPRRIEIYPGVFPGGLVDLPLDPTEVPADVQIHLPEDWTEDTPFQHRKLFGFETDSGECWQYTGSANCTVQALTSLNVEAGILRRVSRDRLRSSFARPDRTSLEDFLQALRQSRPGHDVASP